MATFVNNLRLKEITPGDEDGTWGGSTNTNLELIADAFGAGTLQLAADANETFTMADGAADDVRALFINITSAGSLTATRTVTLAPNTVNKVWVIKNSTSGGQAIEISQGSGGNVTIANGETKAVYSDGAGSGAAVADFLAGLTISGAFGAEGAVTLESTLDVLGALTQTSTDAGATIGPVLTLHRDSASPADDDVIGGINFDGEDDGGNQTTYARVNAEIKDVTDGTEDGDLVLSSMRAGTLTEGARLSSIGRFGVGTASPGAPIHAVGDDNNAVIIAESTDADATQGPVLLIDRNSASPADGDELGAVFFRGRNSAAENTDYATIRAVAVDVTDGTEDGALEFDILSNGLAAQRMTLDSSGNLDLASGSVSAAGSFYTRSGTTSSLSPGGSQNLFTGEKASVYLVTAVNNNNNADWRIASIVTFGANTLADAPDVDTLQNANLTLQANGTALQVTNTSGSASATIRWKAIRLN